jgi:ribosome-associated protein
MEEYGIDEEFIELHDLLKVMGFFPTGGMAKAAIAEGLVTVDGNVETRKRCKIKRGQIVEYGGGAVKVTGKGNKGICCLNGGDR